MKKYVVCKVYNSDDITPSVVAHFDDEIDALTYARLSAMSDTDHKYATYDLVGHTGK